VLFQWTREEEVGEGRERWLNPYGTAPTTVEAKPLSSDT
jgi:hypothetical protein